MVANKNTMMFSDIISCSLVSSEAHSAPLFYTENGSNMFLRRVEKYLPD
jgi:hypothetical protein